MVAGWRVTKRDAQMSTSSEHEFEARMSEELSGEIFR